MSHDRHNPVQKDPITEEYLEKATAFSHYGGSASAYEVASALALKRAAEIWMHVQSGNSPIADELKNLSSQFAKLGEDERKKQRETGFIKL